MKYTVVWSPEAEDRLAEVWLEASDQRAVTTAQAAIDAERSSDPESKGADVAEGLRKLKVEPLVVLFEVEPADRLVKVIAVRKMS